MEAVVFFIAAGVTLAGACGVVLLKNPVHAALSLVGTLFGVAIHFINLEAYFLAAVQVIVYAGAIVILFLFVIMLLDVKEEERRRYQKFGTFLGFAAVTGLATLIINTIKQSGVSQALTGDGVAETKPLGKLLFTDYLLPFEIVSILLLVAMVGCILLSKREETAEAEAE